MILQRIASYGSFFSLLIGSFTAGFFVTTSWPSYSQVSSGKKKGKGPVAAPPKESRGPYSLIEVAQLLSTPVLKDGADNLVEQYGIGFSADEATIRLLESLGASSRLIQLIPRVVPTPKPLAGELKIACRPDCEIRIDDRYFGPTTNGIRSIRGLHPGSAVVTVSSEGLVAQSQSLVLKQNMPEEVSFELNPSAAALSAQSDRVKLQLLQTFGGVAGLVESGTFSASGTLSLWSAPDRSSETVELTMNGSPNSTRGNFRLEWRQCEYRSGSASTCLGKAPKVKDKKNSADADRRDAQRIKDITAAIDLINEYHPWRIASLAIENADSKAPSQSRFPGEFEHSVTGQHRRVSPTRFERAGNSWVPMALRVSPGPAGYAAVSIRFHSFIASGRESTAVPSGSKQ